MKDPAAVRKSAIGRRDLLKLGAGALAASALMSRKSSAQNNVGPPISIDMHTHWAPEAYTKALSKTRHPGGANPNPLDFDLDKRRQWMDTHGVQMHVLTLSGGMPWQWVPPDVGAYLAQVINDANVEAHTAHPDRFVGGIEVSIRDPQLAIKELNRMAGKPGMRAVHLPNSIEGHDYLFEERYAPFLARVEELGYPLLFHPLDGEENIFGGWQSRLGTPVARASNLNNTLGFPFESETTATKFIITGTLDKYPKLDIVLPHSGGSFPFVVGRIHRGIVNRGNYKKRQAAFRDYIRRFHYDTLTYYPETLRYLINLMGADRVVIGTDNYAIMDVEYPNALVEQLKLPAADREKILRGNAARLLKLGTERSAL
jgi:aminocarboxymuconate-semialdehyde decarboxylase